MSQTFRRPEGGRIKRNKPVAFRFDGRALTGYEGDTLASALLANGVHLVGRSFKYHRPRGILTAGAEEPNALVTVSRDAARSTPNLRATQVEIYEGMTAESQNRWPSLAFDASAVNDLLSPIFVSGFYYKTFMWPAKFWKSVYEPRIRAAAGLGKAPELPDPDRYQSRFAHCDVLVIGAGPAGLAAALAAMESGARVILCDEQAEMGGSLLSDPDVAIEGQSGRQWSTDVIMALALSDRVTCLTRTTAFGYFADNFVALAERITDHMAAPPAASPRERMWQVRAKQVVIATGAIERPLVFPENDRPGILFADAGRTYLNRYGVMAGRKTVVATACDSAYLAALDLHRAGVEVPAILDIRREGGALTAAARAAGIRVETGATVTGTRGRLRVASVEFGHVQADGSVRHDAVLPCDSLLMSGGWTPTLHMFSQSRGKLRFDEATGRYLPGLSAEHERSAGACNGTMALGAVLDEGYAAGESAARAAGLATRGTKTFAVAGATTPDGQVLGALPHDRNPGRVKAFVDFQHDVTAKDIKLAVREGFRSIEHVKRYTTTGMATDQGKTSNMNALAIAAGALDKPIPAVGLTTFRMPYTPTTFGIFANTSRGDLFDPVRKTSTHDWAAAAGAEFENVGLWKRAWYFPRSGETMHQAVDRECRTVRSAVGIFDASTLGKIEVVGPDAAEFMHRIYVNPFLKLEVGRCRYGIMCRDDGFVYDDGVVGRIAADRFHVTTTTGGAPRVLSHMEDYLQTEWPDLKVWLTSTSEQWAVIAVQGPKAREAIAPLIEGIDVSKAAMPHMSVRIGTILGVPCRLFRMSFTGELGFEINVPAAYGKAIWEAVHTRVVALGGCPYGTEAMHVLRAEKGYIIVGQDTDGTVTPDEAGVGWAVGKSKPDFVGKRGLARADLLKPGRTQLVGLATVDPKVVLEEGAQITQEADPAPRTHAIGHVTSAYHSAVLGRSIALAMVERGRSRLGETLHVPMPGGAIAVTVVDPVFYDKEGGRLDP
ncbi:sarcosine oxidase subunit alpha family protein [Prosthecodimorpha staleyi]|uniref:Sarcosine oxidase subunit alpha family protein n=1 Tax=Prosthecodimorpha staleyi TaxID=2840188 RepID=A0A947D3N1_9HYPH|nr:sarcosine oxidase subunit alpha family protein [Prosthecodimorpha staleyi]MBT9290415.1 sarcosine oxidase subunit alpha family protein [Prosthecodimorpha staleyi]